MRAFVVDNFVSKVRKSRASRNCGAVKMAPNHSLRLQNRPNPPYDIGLTAEGLTQFDPVVEPLLLWFNPPQFELALVGKKFLNFLCSQGAWRILQS